MVEGAGGKDRQWNACGQGGLGRSPHGAVSAGHPQHLGPRRRALHHLRHVVVGGEFDHRDVGQVALHPGQHVVPLAAVRRRIDHQGQPGTGRTGFGRHQRPAWVQPTGGVRGWHQPPSDRRHGGAEHETGRDVRRVVGTGRHPREAHQAGQRGQGHAQRGYLECHRAREGGRTGRVTAGKRGRGGNAPGDARERYPQQRWAWPPVQPFGHLVGDQAGGGQGGETAAGGSTGPRRAGEGEHGGQPHPQLGVVGQAGQPRHGPVELLAVGVGDGFVERHVEIVDLAAQRVEPTVGGGHGYLDPDGPSPVVSPDPGCRVSDQAIPGARWARGSEEAPVRTAGGVPAGACMKALRWLGMSSNREC